MKYEADIRKAHQELKAYLAEKQAQRPTRPATIRIICTKRFAQRFHAWKIVSSNLPQS